MTMQANWYDRKVTLYRSVKDMQGCVITAGEWLCLPYKATPEILQYLNTTPEQLRSVVDAVRATDKTTNKAQYDELKKQLPCCAFSGIFTNGRREDNITERSKLVVLDIDRQDNPDKTPEQICEILQRVPEIVYAGRSVGGAGIWAILQVSTTHHKQHCRQLIEDFKRVGVNLDPACVDIPRTRFFSYDDNPAIFKREAIEYAGLYVEPQRKERATQAPILSESDRQKDVCRLLDKVLHQRANICPDYNDWYRLGAALQELGQIGCNYFHALSAVDPRYKESETQRKWEDCKKMSRLGIGTIFELAKTAGVKLYDTPREYTPRVVRATPPPRVKWATPPPMERKQPPTPLQMLANINQTTQGALRGLVDIFKCELLDGANIIDTPELLQALR